MADLFPIPTLDPLICLFLYTYTTDYAPLVLQRTHGSNGACDHAVLAHYVSVVTF